MSDLISRQAAIDAMQCVTDSICAQQAIDALSTLPSAERRGRWILGGEEGWPKWTCSVCGGDGRGDYKICPWCGAKMEEGGE